MTKLRKSEEKASYFLIISNHLPIYLTKKRRIDFMAHLHILVFHLSQKPIKPS